MIDSMKKILILILSIVTTTALWADRFRVGDLCFNVTSSSRPYTVEVSTNCYSFSGRYSGLVSFIIPETITYDGITYSVTGIGEFAFSDCSSLVSVTIPKSVTQIEQYAFNGCTQLSSITIPNGVTSIGKAAFNGCKSLTSITIPYNVTSLGIGAFANCSSLTSIKIPSGVTSIGEGVFMGCSSLSSITVGRGNVVYDSRNDCNAIIVSASDILLAGCKNTIIPNDIVGIATAAFSGCTLLESITIPESVMNIGNEAFQGCNALSKIIMESNNPPTIERLGYLPGTMIHIPDNSLKAYQSAWDTKYKKYDFFHNGNTLTLHVETPGTLSKLLDEQGVDPMKVKSINLTGTINNSDWWDFYLYGFYKLKYMDLSGLSNTSDGFFPYPKNVKLERCMDLVQVILPKNLKRIESNAFKYFRKLRYITIPNSVESIGSSAFYGCTALISMIIPNSVTTIEAEAFAYCDYLTSISIPNSVITIQDEAFKHCASLNSITIPNSVTSIGAKAFHDCHKLDFVNIPESVTRIGIYAFDCSRFKHSLSISKDGALYIDNCLIKVNENQNGDFVIKPGTRLIADGAFEGCTSLTSVTIPNSIASIGDYTFYGCSSLTSVTIPNSVTSIGKYAFCGCSSLTSVTIPNSVTSIGEYAFCGCSSFSSVTIPNSVTSIEAGTFEDCNSLTSVTIHDRVKSIGSRAFSHCSLLASVTIPNNVMEIGEEALVGTIIYNDSTNWENGALYIDNCLLKVKEEKIGDKYTIKSGTRLIADAALSGCNELRSIKIPNSVKIIGARAFEYCSSLPSITLPESVRSIGVGAFSKCLELTSIAIPEGVTEIAPQTFFRCFKLDSVGLPNSLMSIGNQAFYGYTVNSIYVKATTPPIIINDEVFNNNISICNIPCGTLLAYVTSDWAQYVDDFKENCDGNVITYTSSEDTIVSIRTVDAFDATIVSNTYEDGIGTIIFDAPLTNIRDSAFNGCASLSSITIPKTVTKIGVAVFEDCDALTSITVANGNTIYDSRDNCNAIITIADNELVAGCQSTVIPNGVTSIGTGAFRGCDSLIKITIPESVTSIEAYAFAKCESLDSINVKATTPPILAGNVFENSPATICYVPCGTLKEYETSEWAKYVGKLLEKDCQKCGDYLYWEVVDNQLIITGTGDMYHFDTIPQPWEKMRYQIQQISMPEGMTSIGASAFKECLFVTTVTIPSTVKEIHYRAFEDCRMLSNVSFVAPSALTTIGHWVFYNCHKLSSITVPEGVTVMGEEVFYGCEVGKAK